LQELGREPTPAEIGAELDLKTEKVEEIQRLTRETVSLEAPIGDSDASLGDFIEDEDSAQPEEVASDSMMKRDLGRVLASLSERERRILELRYGLHDRDPMTLEQVGKALGVTRERVRQMELKTLRRLEAFRLARALRDSLD